MDDFRVLGAENYYNSLLREIPKAKKRIVIASMALLWGERTAPVFIMLQDAIKRGVKVTVLLDNYTRLTYFLDLQPPSSGKERLRQTYRTLEDLSALGAKVYNFGKIGFPPQKGRCHLKITVIDNSSYAFGGVNFLDESLTNADYMLANESPEIADRLAKLVERVCKNNPPLADSEVELSRDTRILFDGGRPKQSLIYERASELTAQAKRVYFASQMVPSGQLAKLLQETKYTVYSNRPEQMSSLAGIAQAFDQQKYRIDNAYTGVQYIHAKFMLFELPGGRKALLSGSHNFSHRGVSFGTQEIALHSTNPKLYEHLHNYLQKNIATPKPPAKNKK
jgi:phosphatidylserine/phosphatidylglycerophosphate/cardiolipin synthase-like enzyme